MPSPQSPITKVELMAFLAGVVRGEGEHTRHASLGDRIKCTELLLRHFSADEMNALENLVRDGQAPLDLGTADPAKVRQLLDLAEELGLCAAEDPT